MCGTHASLGSRDTCMGNTVPEGTHILAAPVNLLILAGH